jgi:hypothetical protein
MVIFSELFISSLVPIRPKLEVKRHNLTKAEQSQFTLSADLKNILVGLILGDLYIQKSKGCVNPTLRFEQGLVHEDYLFPLYELFKNYCSSAPKIRNVKPNKETGKIYRRIFFLLICYPVLTSYMSYFM